MVGKGLQVLHDRCEVELVARAGEAPETQALEAMMGLQVRKPHLDLLAFVARFVELRRACTRSAKIFVAASPDQITACLNQLLSPKIPVKSMRPLAFR